MKVKVVNKADSTIFNIYENVNSVTDTFDDNGNYCHQLHIGEETATFPAMDWAFFELTWVSMF